MTLKEILERLSIAGANLRQYPGNQTERIAAARAYALVGKAWNELHIAIENPDAYEDGVPPGPTEPRLDTLAIIAIRHHMANTMALPHEHVTVYERALKRSLTADELADMEAAWDGLGRRKWADIVADTPLGSPVVY